MVGNSRVPPTAKSFRPSFFVLGGLVRGACARCAHGVPISMPGRAIYAPSIWHARDMTAARGLASPESQAEQREQAESESEDRPSLERRSPQGLTTPHAFCVLIECERCFSTDRQAVGLTCPRVGGSAMASHLPRARTESACSGKCLVETRRSGVSTTIWRQERRCAHGTLLEGGGI